jgi:hypothetical protein
MNINLRKEIISHIFYSIGIFDDLKNKFNIIEKLNSDKFLLDKKIAFETEDKKQIKNNLWAARTKIDNSEIKMMIADISEDVPEFALIIQMDSFMPQAIRLSLEEDDYGDMFVNIKENSWVNTSTREQAKMLIGFESLLEIFAGWNRLDKYMDLYKVLVGFLNFSESIGE